MAYKNREESLAYMREWNKKWYQQNKEKAAEKVRKQRDAIRELIASLKAGKGCERCPKDRVEDHPACLDFHHRDPAEKDFDISQALVGLWGKERILREVAKCELICSNCHRKLHWNEKQSGLLSEQTRFES